MNSINLGRISFIALLVIVAIAEVGGCGGKGPGRPPLPTPTPIPSKPACDCSVHGLICTLGTSTCLEFDCEPSPYHDGKCFLYAGPEITEPLRSDAGKLFGIAFSAYQDAVRSGKGSPDEKAWKKIQKKAPNEDIANAVVYMTNDFLYIALAQDVKALTPEGPAGECEITQVSDKKATLGLIEAIKSGTILALQKSSPSEINAPIAEFFKKNPDFKPVKPGYCYSDNSIGSPAECIGKLLEMRLGLLIK